MAVEIIFESHGTTYDNEAHLSSGHFDVELSPLGIQQSKEMGERYKNDHFDAILCSDLQRSYKSGEIAFGKKFPIIKDARLRECDYGELTQHPSAEVDGEKVKRISIPFPGGESYEQTAERMKSFLQDTLKNYDGKRVMIIGHRATQYGLEHWINGLPLEEVIPAPWKWQPGWTYTLKEVVSDTKYQGRKYKVLGYSKDWQGRFLEESAILKSILKDDTLAIEHIGSTAVEGLAGKPTIDVLVVIEDVAIVDKHTPEMMAAGYRDLGEYVLPETRLFVREEDNTRLVNVHFFLQGHPHTEEMILVRDYLRSHPEEVKKYGELKQRLYQEHPNDYGAYRKPKDEYMEELLKRAKSSNL